MKSLTLIMCLFGLVISQQTMADDKADVAEIAKDATTKIVAILNDESLDPETSKGSVRSEIEKVFDFPLTAKLTLGRAYWPKLNAEQKKEFQELFIKNIINSYYDKAKQFADETITYEDPQKAGNKVQVAISFASKGEKIRINSKFYQSQSGWMIYDMEIQDVSIVRSYGSQYTEVLKSGTPDDLLEKMRAKLNGGGNPEKEPEKKAE